MSEGSLPVGRPLKGVQILELAHIAAGPTAGMVLTGLGAEVVKVEGPGGDQSRKPPVPSTFVYLNRGKRSVSLDLKADSDRQEFLELVQDSDAVISNYAVGVMERLGVGYEVLRRVNPQIVYGTITGYPTGPLEQQPALDEVIQMQSGLAYLTGPSGRPLRAGASVLDMTAGLLLALGVVAALRKREATGVGAAVTTSLLDAGAFYTGQALARYQLSGQPSVPFPDREGAAARLHGWGVYDVFETADARNVFLGITSNRHWRSFCDLFELPELRDDSRYDGNLERLRARPVLMPTLRAVVRAVAAKEFLDRCHGEMIPCAPVQAPEGALDDEAYEQLFAPTRVGGREIRLPRFALGWLSDETEQYDRAPLGDPPELGRDLAT